MANFFALENSEECNIRVGIHYNSDNYWYLHKHKREKQCGIIFCNIIQRIRNLSYNYKENQIYGELSNLIKVILDCNWENG
ncbi:unnamed protein product [Trifolium pratense]|uniref:Uncharacterized protein n=1 Tax=Trifolium pratense TaxID=57577 RepID=A0ACB0M8T8_TRIPR|nr:unnamed protein product [Trifolium pratense]